MTEDDAVQHLADKVRRLVRDRVLAEAEADEAAGLAAGATPAQAADAVAAAYADAMQRVDAEMPRLTGEIRQFVREAARRR
ncbi:MAG: hypothetical protein K0S00_3979 [Xanthobacteraceae bacterium]|jgi:hypothetical protein|nr:hypothetical protein [Xanthobacteraceae bacterium]